MRRRPNAEFQGPWLCGLVCLCLLACEVDGAREPTVTQIKGVTLEVTGRALSQGGPAAGAPLLLTRAALVGSATREEITADHIDPSASTTGSDGSFRFTLEGMDVETYRYELVVESPDPGRYLNSEAQLLYSRRDAATDLGEIELEPTTPWRVGDVEGSILEGVRTAYPIPDVRVRLLADGEVVAETTSDEDGVFSLKNVPLRTLTMELDAEGVLLDGFAYASQRLAVDLEQVLLYDLGELGPFFLLPKVDSGQVRLMLSWQADICDEDESFGRDFDLNMAMPSPSCDVNHLGQKQMRLIDPSEAIIPDLGFMKGTCYWASGARSISKEDQVTYLNHGGACAAPPDLALDEETLDQNPVPSGACVTASLDNISSDGCAPEVLTIHQEWPLETRSPEALSWFYEYALNDLGQIGTRYPIGVMDVWVEPAGGSDNFTTDVKIDVFQGNQYVGAVAFPVESESSEGESWLALHVEYGFQTPLPVGPQELNSASGSELYFRVVPASLDVSFDPHQDEVMYPTDATGTEGFTAARHLDGHSEQLAVLAESPDGRDAVYTLSLGDDQWQQQEVFEEGRRMTGLWVSPEATVVAEGDTLHFLGGAIVSCDAKIEDVVALGARGERDRQHQTFVVSTAAGLRVVRPDLGLCDTFAPTTCRAVLDCKAECEGDEDCLWRCGLFELDDVAEIEECLGLEGCLDIENCDLCNEEVEACNAQEVQTLPEGLLTGLGRANVQIAGQDYLLVSVRGEGVFFLGPDGWVSQVPLQEDAGPDANALVGAEVSVRKLVSTRAGSFCRDIWALTTAGVFVLDCEDPVRWDPIACEEGVCLLEALGLVDGRDKTIILSSGGLWIADTAEAIINTERVGAEEIRALGGALYGLAEGRVILLEGAER